MGPKSLSVVSNFYSFITNRTLNNKNKAIFVPIRKIIHIIFYAGIKAVFSFLWEW